MKTGFQYGMGDPTHTMTKKEKAALDAQAQDEMGTPEFPDDPLDANDLDDVSDDDDDGDDDDEITAADIPADVIPDDDGSFDDDDPEEKPEMNTDKNGMSDAAQMVHSCENCGKENYVLAPKGFRYAKAKTAAKPAGLTQRLKHIGEALAPVFVFKSVYREARRPKNAPLPS